MDRIKILDKLEELAERERTTGEDAFRIISYYTDLYIEEHNIDKQITHFRSNYLEERRDRLK